MGRPASNSTGPGHADADAPQPPGQGLGRLQERPDERVHAVQAALGSGLDPGRLVVVTQDPAVEGRDRDIDAGGAEVGDQDVAAVGVEGQLARRPAARAGPDVALGDEAALDQLADPLRDDRPAQAGPLDELGSRPRPSEPDLVEHRDERIERLVGHGSEAVVATVAIGCRWLGHVRMIRPSVPVRGTFAVDMGKYDAEQIKYRTEHGR